MVALDCNAQMFAMRTSPTTEEEGCLLSRSGQGRLRWGAVFAVLAVVAAAAAATVGVAGTSGSSAAADGGRPGRASAGGASRRSAPARASHPSR